MKIAVIGLAYTHPYSYSKILKRSGHDISYAWDDVPERLEEYCAEFGAKPVASPEDVPVDEIDGVITTGCIPERIDHSILFLERDVPVYASKPMATSQDQLNKLVSAVKRTGTPFLSTSVLRYAPAVISMRNYIEAGTLGTLTYVRGISSHFISHYMEEPGIWQDDPKRGGGTIINMGVHALEMLVTIFGHSICSVFCKSEKILHKQSLSEDTAMITLGWDNGLLGLADVPCGVNSENFGLEAYGSDGILKMSIPKGDIQDSHGGALGNVDKLIEFGYVGTINAFLDMCRTRQPQIPIQESEAIAKVLLAARQSAASGVTVLMENFES